MDSFGSRLTALRRRAGLGLRTFAELIADRSSNVSAIELGQRLPWQRSERLSHVADVLGLVSNSDFCGELFALARHEGGEITEPTSRRPGQLAWWWCTEDAPFLAAAEIQELERFLGLSPCSEPTSQDAAEMAARELALFPTLTELAIEWRVRRLVGSREKHLSAAPVDVEAVLERSGQVKIEILSGLIPNFSVSACVVVSGPQLTLVVDRIVADSRPLASYRDLLAQVFAPAALWLAEEEQFPAGWFAQVQNSEEWPRLRRDCRRFALSLLLPADPVLGAAESAYREVIEQQGWVETEVAANAVRNRLAEQFAVPPLLIHTRLVRWPCHVYGRIAQALAAQEPNLPPVDWLLAESPPNQKYLFEEPSAPQSKRAPQTLRALGRRKSRGDVPTEPS